MEMMMKRYGVYALMAMMVLAGGAAAQDKDEKQPWTAQEYRLVDRPDEIVAVLGNGMVAIVKENHTAPVAAVRVYIRAGSIYEQDRLGAGLSHLIEHQVAGGATKSRSEEETRKLLQQIGARHNAYTGKARTCYFITAPAQHVGTALELLADWVSEPTFPKEAFEREWGVVQRELEMRAATPARQLYYLLDELRYKVHPGRYPIIGHQAIVQQMKLEDVIDYYQRMYVPDNMVVVVAGDIRAQEMLEAIKKEFADFTRRAAGKIVLPEEPELTGPRESVKVMPEMQGPAKMAVGFPSFDLQDEDLYATDMLANIMGEGKSSRLYRRLREEEQLVLGIDCWNYTPNWAAGTFAITCEVTPEKVAAAKKAIWEEIEKLKAEPVAEAELERAKRQLAVGHIRRNQTAGQQAASMADDYLATGDAHFSGQYVAKMQQVDAAAVMAAAQRYLQADKQITVVVTPTALPKEEEQNGKKAGESAIRKIVLENGLKVLLKRNPAVPLVNMQLYVLGGLLDETDENSGLTNVMTQLSTKGTKSYSAEEIVDYFDGIGGTIAAGCGNNTYFYRSEVMRQDFGQALARLAEIALEPTFLEEELVKVREVSLANIKQIENTWHRQASRFFREKFYVNSPYQRTQHGTTAAVEALSREQVSEFHKAHTLGARSVLAIFGDIDLDEAERLVREEFAGMAAGVAADWGSIAPEPEPTETREFVQQGSKPGATVVVGFPGIKLTDIQERDGLEVMTEIIGSNSGWLHEELRGKQLVYYAWGYSFPGLLPGFVAATAQCEAEKAGQVRQVIQELLAKAAAGEFTEEELANAKGNRINAEVLERQTNDDAAAQAGLDELYGFGYDWSDSHADRIMAVSMADVREVAAKYLAAPATVTIITSEPALLAAEKSEESE